MALTTTQAIQTPSPAWYALSPEEVATALGVDPTMGLPAARAAK